jgi:hypothetical protein
MTKSLNDLNNKIIAMSAIMEDEIANLKANKQLNQKFIEDKEALLKEIEEFKDEIALAKNELNDDEKKQFHETLSIFLDLCSLLKFELEKGIYWTNEVINAIGSYIDIKVKGIKLYSKSGKSGVKHVVSKHAQAIALFEKI